MKHLAVLILAFAAACLADTSAQAKIVAYNLYVVLDKFAPSTGFKVGDIHGGRIIFDDSEVDPTTGRVHPIGFMHWLGGRYVPPALDPTKRDKDTWIDVKSQPWRFHMNTAPGPNSPNAFSPVTRRMEIHDPKTGDVVVAGPYHFDPAFLTEAEIKAFLAPPPK